MTPFEQLLTEATPEMADLARATRERILQMQPKAHEEVETAWGGYLLFHQVAEAGTTVCWISTHQRHVSLGFPEGTLLADPSGLLEGTGKSMRHVKLKNRTDLERPELSQLIGQAWSRQPSPQALTQALARVRRLCLSWPNTSEKRSHGHPTFYAGKRSFCVYGLYAPAVAFRPAPERALALSEEERFFPTPYLGKDGWISLRLEEETDWKELEDLLEESYRQASKRPRKGKTRVHSAG